MSVAPSRIGVLASELPVGDDGGVAMFRNGEGAQRIVFLGEWNEKGSVKDNKSGSQNTDTSDSPVPDLGNSDTRRASTCTIMSSIQEDSVVLGIA
jgi:hypothetical protein